MGLHIVHAGCVDSPTQDPNCFWNSMPLGGTPAPNPVEGKAIYMEKELVLGYNSTAQIAPVPGVMRNIVPCTPTSRTIVDAELRCQKVKFHGKPLAQPGDYSYCGNTTQQRTIAGPGKYATIHIGTIRPG